MIDFIYFDIDGNPKIRMMPKGIGGNSLEQVKRVAANDQDNNIKSSFRSINSQIDVISKYKKQKSELDKITENNYKEFVEVPPPPMPSVYSGCNCTECIAWRASHPDDLS